LLLRAYRSLPKNKALIKFLSEEGIRQLLQNGESYMQDNNREMHKIDEALYFVMEKNNQVELTDNGIKFLSGDTDSDFSFFQILELKLPLSKRKIRKDAEREKERLFQDFGIKVNVFTL
jgi:preprotein translocase subunit SecA